MSNAKKVKAGKPYKMETTEGALYGCEVFVNGISTVTCHAYTSDEARKIARGVSHCIEMYPVTFGFKLDLATANTYGLGINPEAVKILATEIRLSYDYLEVLLNSLPDQADHLRESIRTRMEAIQSTINKSKL